MTQRSSFGLTLAVLLGSACAGDGSELTGGTDNGAVTLLGDVQPILTVNCAVSGCHVGTNPPEGQNLSSGQTFSNVVNVVSNQATPAMNRVTPGEPDNSYLVHKIEGTHVSVGGSGERMPRGRTPLTQTQINTIRAWITAGALNN